MNIFVYNLFKLASGTSDMDSMRKLSILSFSMSVTLPDEAGLAFFRNGFVGDYKRGHIHVVLINKLDVLVINL